MDRRSAEGRRYPARDGFPVQLLPVQGYKRQGRPQALAWPRVNVIDGEGGDVAFDAVPVEIQEATAEVALREPMSPGSMNLDFLATDQVKREKVGQIEVESLNANTSVKSARPILLIVQDIIGPLLRAGAGRASSGVRTEFETQLVV